MVNFNDLSQEDQNRLLEQARQIIDDENLNKNAIAMYAIKKKDLLEKNLEELSKIFNISKSEYRYACDKPYNNMKQRYTSMTNYLYRISNSSVTTSIIISNADEWKLYQEIAGIVKDMMIRCYNITKS